MPFPAFPAPGGYAWGDFIKFGGALQLLHMRGQGLGILNDFGGIYPAVN